MQDPVCQSWVTPAAGCFRESCISAGSEHTWAGWWSSCPCFITLHWHTHRNMATFLVLWPNTYNATQIKLLWTLQLKETHYCRHWILGWWSTTNTCRCQGEWTGFAQPKTQRLREVLLLSMAQWWGGSTEVVGPPPYRYSQDPEYPPLTSRLDWNLPEVSSKLN